jgi:CspA family cold shock protein
MEGEIGRLRFDRGFGFIRGAEGGEDIFFHRSVVEDGGFDLLREGQKVSYEVESSPRGPRATHVKPVS